MNPADGHPYLEKKPRDIRRLFDGIARRYDFLNHLLSFNLDRRWRRDAIAELEPVANGRYLDACAGTGDLAFALVAAEEATVHACDLSLEMLRRGELQCHARPVRFICADLLRLPFPDEYFDGATIGFGIRNVENLSSAFAELRRVLRPGGRLVLLEFTRVRSALLRPVMNAYRRWLLPVAGDCISGSPDRAYHYLSDSVDSWSDGEHLAALLRRAGFHGVRWRALFPGNVALHRGYR